MLRMKKTITLLLAAALAVPAALGQQVSVSVRTSDVALPFAFVSVNNRYRGMTDSLGVMRIDKAGIHSGDTISANYVGQHAQAVYRGADRVELNIDVAEITGVTVMGGRFKFWKHIKQPRLRHNGQSIYGHFEFTSGSRKVAGEGWYATLPKPVTPADASGYEVAEKLSFSVSDTLFNKAFISLGKYIVNSSSVEIGFSSNSYNDNMKVVREERKDDGVDVYSFIRTPEALGEVNIRKQSIRVYVDRKTKQIVRASSYTERENFTLIYDATYAVTDGTTHATGIDAKADVPRTGHEIRYRFSNLRLDKRQRWELYKK